MHVIHNLVSYIGIEVNHRLIKIRIYANHDLSEYGCMYVTSNLIKYACM